MMPIAEAQGSWVASYLKGEYALPPRSQLLRDIAEDTRGDAQPLRRSKRHTIQVDFDDYLFELAASASAARSAPAPPASRCRSRRARRWRARAGTVAA